MNEDAVSPLMALLGNSLIIYMGYMWVTSVVSYLMSWVICKVFDAWKYSSQIFGILLLHFGFIGFVILILEVAKRV